MYKTILVPFDGSALSGRAVPVAVASPADAGPARAFAEAAGLKRMVLGSVADEVIRHTHTPVLVYRPS